MFNLGKFFSGFRIRHRLKTANKFYVQHEYKKAIPLYKKILCDNPLHYGALCNLAAAYFEDGDYKNALPYFLQLQKVDSTNPWWQTYLSQIYQKQKSYRKALNSAWQAVNLSCGSTEHQINLSYAFYEIALIRGKDFVTDMVQKFYDCYPDSSIAQQCYNTFFSPANSLKCNLRYVEKIFDVFAPEFDEILHRLQYDSPSFVARILADFYQRKKRKLHILDLGCGSGLCAQAIKKIFPRSIIFGVDISAQMLQQADAKKVYFYLSKNNLIDYLKSSIEHFDVIVAADVFTYFGCLDEVINLASHHLKKNGVFIFTVSQNLHNRKKFYLTLSSRFVHNFSYIKKLLKDNGFLNVKLHKKVLRKENGKDIIGGIFLAVKT